MDKIAEKFGNKIRVRVCGLVYKDESILLINHGKLNKENEFWAPPGGGIEFGESSYDALRRELREETGIEVESADFLFMNEFIGGPLHAIELFYHIKAYAGYPKAGRDPEMEGDDIIKDLKFVSFRDLKIMKESKKHNILQVDPSFEHLSTVKQPVLFRSNGEKG